MNGGAAAFEWGSGGVWRLRGARTPKPSVLAERKERLSEAASEGDSEREQHHGGESWRPRTQKREAQAEERGETVLGELVVDEGLSVRILLVLDGILLVLDGRALRPRQRGSRRRPFDQ